MHVERKHKRVLADSAVRSTPQKNAAGKQRRANLIQHPIARGHLQGDNALLTLAWAGDLHFTVKQSMVSSHGP
jgi:hypothetical protein